jgi:hypothetical protein
MSAITIPNSGPAGFSSFVALEKVKESARLFGLLILDPSSAKRSRARGLEPAGIAESVREVAIDASASLPVRLHQRINELAGLEEDWDGEGAKVVKPHVLADVVETLRRLSQHHVFREPFLAPTFDGFVQMEWHDERRWLDVEVTEQGWSAVGTTIGAEGTRHYYTADFERSDFAQLERFYCWLLSDGLLTWPSL